MLKTDEQRSLHDSSEGFVLSWCVASVTRAVTHSCTSQEDTRGGGRGQGLGDKGTPGG